MALSSGSLPSINDANLKRDLAFVHRVLAHLKLDDHTYTHLSARSSNQEHDGFWMSQFGYTFAEVTKDHLTYIGVDDTFHHDDLKHNIIDETQSPLLNTTGPMIHSAIYRARPDLKVVFHLHTPAMVAVSSMQKGLLPLSQWALQFYDRIFYHDYSALALEPSCGDAMAKDLGHGKILMLRHHGVIVCGDTIHEALYYAYHLERACHTQCLMEPHFESLCALPDDSLCLKARDQLLSFEENIGKRDWQAWIRIVGGY